MVDCSHPEQLIKMMSPWTFNCFETQALNDSLQLLLWLTLLLRGALSLCTEDIFTAYLYMLTGSNATVGFIQVTNGLLCRCLSQLLI